MKKIISTLAALSVVIGAAASSYAPVVPVTCSFAAEAEEQAYIFDNPTRSFTEGILKFNLFTGFASVTGVVTDEPGSVEEITVPEEINGVPVIGIEANAFAKCTALKKLELSKNIRIFNWAETAVESIEEVTVDEDSEYFTVSDGILYSRDMSTLVACPPKSGIKEVRVPEATVEIAPFAFSLCKELEKVELTDNIRTIGAMTGDFKGGAFYGCESLSSIELPKDLKMIESFTFAGCSSLKELSIPESVEYIAADAFKDCGCIENVNGIHYVDSWAVGSDKDIETADIREGTTGTAEATFIGTSQLRTLSFPASCKHICTYTIMGVFNIPLERVDIYSPAFPERALVCMAIKEIYVHDPDCVITDSSATFLPYWTDQLALTDYTDDDDTDVKTITRTVTQNNSSSIKKALNTALVEIEEEETENGLIYKLDDGTTFSADSTPEEISEEIAAYMERNKKATKQAPRYYAPVKNTSRRKFDTVIYGHRGSTAEDYALKYRRCFGVIEPMNVTVGPKLYGQSSSGLQYLVYDDHAAAVLSDASKLDNEVTVPEEVQGVPVTAFWDDTPENTSKKFKVHLPKTVRSIDREEITGANNIRYYDISEENPYLCSVDGIVYSKDMTKLVRIPSFYAKSEDIVIQDGVKVVCPGAGYGLEYVRDIVLPSGVEIIKDNAFAYSKELRAVLLPDTLDIIGPGAFTMCTELIDVTIPDSVRHIGYEAFKHTAGVKNWNGGGYIGKWLVENENKNDLSAIKDDTEGIATISFGSSVTIPRSVTKISWEMTNISGNGFERADVYSHVIECDAFKNARAMKDIYIYDPECEISLGENTIPAKYIVKSGKESNNSSQSAVTASGLTRTTDDGTWSTGKDELDDVVIHGYKGSTAELYASLYGRKFVALDSELMYKNGDLNGDGYLSVADLVSMKLYLTGKKEFTEEQFKSADLNGDGNADVFDLVSYRKAVLAQPQRDGIL